MKAKTLCIHPLSATDFLIMSLCHTRNSCPALIRLLQQKNQTSQMSVKEKTFWFLSANENGFAVNPLKIELVQQHQCCVVRNSA